MTDIWDGADRARRIKGVNRRNLIASIAAGASLSGPLHAATGLDDALRFGVFPYLPPLSLDRIFSPVLGSLSTALHRPVLMRTKPSFEQFEAALDDRDYDLAYVHPFLAVRAIDRAGYTPLARLDAPLRVAFLALADSKIASLTDLHGGSVATPPVRAAATILATIELDRRGLRPGLDVDVVDAHSKLSCLHSVLRGDTAACAVPMFAIRQLAAGREAGLRVFHTVSLPISLSIIAGPRVDDATAKRVADEICTWSRTAEGDLILRHAGWQGFALAAPADYDPAREVLQRYAQLGRA